MLMQRKRCGLQKCKCSGRRISLTHIRTHTHTQLIFISVLSLRANNNNNWDTFYASLSTSVPLLCFLSQLSGFWTIVLSQNCRLPFEPSSVWSLFPRSDRRNKTNLQQWKVILKKALLEMELIQNTAQLVCIHWYSHVFPSKKLHAPVDRMQPASPCPCFLSVWQLCFLSFSLFLCGISLFIYLFF